jgi:hypothetical protein
VLVGMGKDWERVMYGRVAIDSDARVICSKWRSRRDMVDWYIL